MPVSLFLEVIFGAIFDGNYPAMGRASIATLIILIAAIVWVFFRSVLTMQNASKQDLNFVSIKCMSVLGLFVHPLGFFLHTSMNWSSANDGQFIMGVGNAFPITSFAFLLVGAVLDWLRHHQFRERDEADASNV